MRIFTVVVTGPALLSACARESEPPTPSPSNEPASQSADLSSEGGAANGTGGGDARDAGRNADPGAFGADCAAGSDCESDVCFLGGKGGSCSLLCKSDADCPPGGDGTAHCNPCGYCRY